MRVRGVRVDPFTEPVRPGGDRDVLMNVKRGVELFEMVVVEHPP